MRDENRDNRLDEIMKNALASEVEPEEELNRRIIQRWKERTDMKRQIRKKICAVAAACGVLMVSVTAGAAVKYLKPAEAAKRAGIEQDKIQAAFLSEDAVEINESKDAGEYRFTLLGITTEQGLEDCAISGKVQAQGDIYAIVAVEHLDGTPMPDTSEDAYTGGEFFMSPLVEGLMPWQYNTASMGGGYSDFVENGILYRVIASDDITMFADRNLYLCISDTAFYDTDAYCYDEASGAITRNEDYDGVNLLFELPIDAASADQEKAASYLKNLESSQEDALDEEEASDEERIDAAAKEVSSLIEEIQTQILNGEEEKALEGAELFAEKTKTVSKQNGVYAYEVTFEGENGELEDTSTMYFYEENIKNGKDVMLGYGDYNESTGKFEGLYISILTENGDGTAEVRSYYKKI